MAKMSLLHAVCTVAMLAAVPALAQPQRPGAGLESANGTPNPDAKQPQTGPMAPANSGANTMSMAPANNGGKSSAATADTHSTHRQAMAQRPSYAMRGHTDTSQDAAVDRLNDQSYQAAEKGQMFGAAGSSGTTSGMTSSGSSTGSGSATSGGPSGAMTNPTK